MLASTQNSTIVRVEERNAEFVVDTVFAGLSAQSRFLRFHSPIPTMTDSLRRRLVDISGRRGAAVAAWACGNPARMPIGLAQLAWDGRGSADIAVAVVDAWQRRGVGRRLLVAVAELAEEIGCTELHGSVLAENAAMRGLVRSVFPEARVRFDGDTVQFVVPVGVPTITHEDVLADLLYRGGR